MTGARCAGDFVDSDRGTWVPTLDVNLKAALVGVQLAARVMKPGDNGVSSSLCDAVHPAWEAMYASCVVQPCLTACPTSTRLITHELLHGDDVRVCALAGMILLMASAGGLFPMPATPVYSASKVLASAQQLLLPNSAIPL